MEKLDDIPVVAGASGYLLRPWDPVKDVKTVLEAGTDPHIVATTSVPSGGGIDDAVAFIERQQQRLVDGTGFSFAIAPTGGGSAVGQIGVWTQELRERGRVTLGYWVTPTNRRLGVGTAALDLATNWAHTELQAVRCQLFVEPWNEGSWRVAERVGYEREGLLHAWQRIDGKWRDLFAYSQVWRE